MLLEVYEKKVASIFAYIPKNYVYKAKYHCNYFAGVDYLKF